MIFIDKHNCIFNSAIESVTIYSETSFYILDNIHRMVAIDTDKCKEGVYITCFEFNGSFLIYFRAR